MSADDSGGSCQEVSVSAGRSSSGWGTISVSTGESGGELCGGSGCTVTSGYWAVDVRAGSWEEVIVFSDDGDSTLGNTGSAGRAAGLSKATPGRSSLLLAASSALFDPWAKGSRKAASTTSLVHGSMAVSVAPEVSDWVGADDRVGVGRSSSSVSSALGSSSLGSQTGMIGLSALWVLKPALG